MSASGRELALRVVFDPAFDEGAWPGPAPGAIATAGEAWVGLRGLVALLEGHLGLRRPWPGEARRAASLASLVRKREGFWSRSAEVDPLGTSRRLLHWRDTLRMGGWRGQPASPRLDALWALTEGHSGLPERLDAILERLPKHGSPLQEFRLFSWPLEQLARTLLQKLQAHETPLEDAETRGDLLAARRDAFRPTGDGTLQLIRPGGPLEAAEELAAWLASQPDPGGTLVVTPSPILDGALHRAGLPTLGVAAEGGQEPLLQVLPLVLACGWDPPDPERALELLTVGVGPIRHRVARELARALKEWPAVGSEAWHTALERALTGLDDAEKVRERVQGFLHGEVERDGGYPAVTARRRADRVASWLRGRLAFEEGDRASWSAALEQVAEFDLLVAESGLQVLTETQLQRLLAQATAAASPLAVHPACAGLHGLGSPGAVVGPARRIIWWNFCLSTVSPPGRLPLTAEEQHRLSAAGVELPDPGLQARAEAERWRRPLRMASDCLLLVSPRRSDGGGAEFPHPLWDEVAARAGEDRHLLERERPFGPAEAPRLRREAKRLASPRRHWSVRAGSIPGRAKESPHSLSKLVGCPFSWAVQYGGSVWPGETGGLPGEATLLGKLAHEVLERVLPRVSTNPSTARSEAEALFDELGPKLAAPLFLPGADAARAQARQVAGVAAEVLARDLSKAGMRVLHVEGTFQREGLDGLVEGRMDLVVGPPETVLDLKWSGTGRFVQLLQNGTAYQLATYSHLRDNAPVGYFTLVDASLLVNRDGLFEGARVVEGPPPEETWRGLEEAVRARRREIAQGRLEAPGNAGEDGESGTTEDGLVEGRLVLAPTCRWCDLGVLCGQVLAEEEVRDADHE